MVCVCASIEKKLDREKEKQIKRQIIHARGCMISKENRAAMISAMQSAVKETGKEHTGRVVPVRMKSKTRVNGIQMLLQVVQVKGRTKLSVIY